MKRYALKCVADNCQFGYGIKSIAYIQDGLLINNLSFWVLRVTKRDALVLATLRYVGK